MDNPKTIDISVIVCTHNRAATLGRTLESLASQTVDPSQYEIIVVDNASTDHTKTLVEELITQGLHLRYVFEDKDGLSHARNSGIQEAKGDVIAFIDDDAEAEPDWLCGLMNTFYGVYPLPSCVGGKVEPKWEGIRPKWLPNCLIPYLGMVDWGNVPHWISFPKEYIVGVNMAFVKTDLVGQGGFNSSLGRIGNSLLSNEEILLLYKLQNAGKGIYYQPKACVRHLVSKSRLTRSYFLRRAYWQGISDSIVHHLLGNSTPRKRLGRSKWMVQNCLKNAYFALKAVDQREQTRYFAESARSLGAAFQEARFIVDPLRLRKRVPIGNSE